MTYDPIAAVLKLRDRVLRMPHPTPEVLRSLARSLELAADLASDDDTRRKLRAMSVDALAAANKLTLTDVPARGRKR